LQSVLDSSEESKGEPRHQAPQQVSATVTKASIVSPLARFASNKPTEPPYHFEFSLGHPSGLSALDVDIIKLTAQYTVINGRDFLGGLAQREQRNPQFDFLKPTHMLFSYFTTLVDAYAKILQPSATLRARIKSHTNRMKVLESAVYRWEWLRAEEEKKRRETQEADAERNAFQAIDWYDFVVAETITFGEDELLEFAGLRVGAVNNTEDMDMDMDMETENDKGNGHASSIPPPPPPPPVDDHDDEDDDMDIKVVSDYRPRTQTTSKTPLTMIDPISGKVVPVSDMAEHMRIQLLDPRWREEQRRFQDKQQGSGFAAGGSIADSLRQFAKQRGDIFGSTEEEEQMLLEENEGRRKRTEVTYTRVGLVVP